ncbi:hypothetical protein STRATTON_56 [Erwinia phage vB_EamM_Stratton]|uniref:Uncharacterized protein n=1 Tax=Erwinia phage vB_EamM_Stratton TaxID=1883378 RepID=A0A1B2IGT6_9CAUD|nr:hypothetical protein STRATTON_56 [Erwinia phage vB_EamM_Stratton]
MIDIYTDYAAVLTVNRHEDRAAPMLDLVTLGIDYGYDVALSDVYFEPSSDPADETIRLEGIIVKCAVALGNRLGVALNPQIVYHKPKETVRILHGLLEKFEDFDDSDSLYGIVMSGETPEHILENMCRVVYGDNNLHFEDLVISVGPRVMTVMRNYLAAAALEEQKGDNDYLRIGRIAAYLRTFPQNPSAFVFLNLPQEPDMLVVQQALSFADDEYSDDELLLMYAVGLSVIPFDDFDGAYGALAGNLEKINTDNYPPLPILEQGLVALKTIYGQDRAQEEENYEQD